MNILKKITSYLKGEKSLKFYDRLWSEPDPKKLSEHLNRLETREKDKSQKAYLSALRADVLEDNPEKSVEIILNNLEKKDLSRDFIRYRLAYLYGRWGKKAEALNYLADLSSDKAIVFRNCLEKINGSFTMTKTMYETAKNFGVHEQFGCLESLIRKYNLKRGAEIGVFMGFHASHLLEACRNLNLVCVDLYGNVEGNGYDDWDNQKFENLFSKVTRKLAPFKRVIFRRELSAEAVKHYHEGELDFVFIDADHRYEGVKNDISIWEPIIKSGGIISGHDYDQPDWPGVRQAVSEWSEKTGREIETGQGNFWWAIK